MRKPYAPADWPETFLTAYRKNGNISQSAKLARVDRKTVYNRRGQSAEFAAAMDSAREEAIDLFEQEALRRGKDGILRPVFYQGAECGMIREYSDRLLIVLLKANRPEKYREWKTAAR